MPLRESQCQTQGAHQAQREAEDEAEGRAMRKRVRRDRERRHELCKMRSCCEACHACVGFCCGGAGVLEGVVEHELGCSAEAAQDMSKGGEQGAGDVRKDEGEGGGQVLVRLAACVARGVGFEGQLSYNLCEVRRGVLNLGCTFEATCVNTR